MNAKRPRDELNISSKKSRTDNDIDDLMLDIVSTSDPDDASIVIYLSMLSRTFKLQNMNRLLNNRRWIMTEEVNWLCDSENDYTECKQLAFYGPVYELKAKFSQVDTVYLLPGKVYNGIYPIDSENSNIPVHVSMRYIFPYSPLEDLLRLKTLITCVDIISPALIPWPLFGYYHKSQKWYYSGNGIGHVLEQGFQKYWSTLTGYATSIGTSISAAFASITTVLLGFVPPYIRDPVMISRWSQYILDVVKSRMGLRPEVTGFVPTPDVNFVYLATIGAMIGILGYLVWCRYSSRNRYNGELLSNLTKLNPYNSNMDLDPWYDMRIPTNQFGNDEKALNELLDILKQMEADRASLHKLNLLVIETRTVDTIPVLISTLFLTGTVLFGDNTLQSLEIKNYHKGKFVLDKFRAQKVSENKFVKKVGLSRNSNISDSVAKALPNHVITEINLSQKK